MSREFIVLEESLTDSKLIEASAGTGKTYSVAILVLRLILEKKIPIEKILMVTFTKAAVAELETRIRKFIRLGYKHVSDQIALKADDKIRIVIENAPGNIDDKKDLLNKAVQSLDNLSVMTIHSFCQSTIGEFTFETNQSFDYEILTDDFEMLQLASEKYTREVLNCLDYHQFEEIIKDLKLKSLSPLLKKYLQGMTFIDSDTFIELSEIDKNEREKRQILQNKIECDLKKIQEVNIGPRTDLGKNRGASDIFLPQFIKYCCVQKKKEFIKLFDFIYYNAGKDYSEALDLKNITYLNFFNKSKELIDNLKYSKGFITYDDQIKTIYKALDNESFKEKLAHKYEAVFIDEFQDTDSYQYEIFSQVFSGNSVLFYIGDPKQSIYGWRGADLDTYKAAKRAVGEDAILTMNTNFRSTKRMIDALNRLLNPGGGFNMFKDDQINYINVTQGALDLGELTDGDKAVPPITVWNFDEDDFETNYAAVAQEIYRLLTADVRLNGQRIMPKDIGVLVREGKEGDKIKNSLAQLDIPSVKRDDTKILESDEARMIRYLVKAVVSPNRGAINRALNLSYFGFDTEALKALNDEKHIEIFTDLRKTLGEIGIYNMISSFLTTYGIRDRCMQDVLGQRVLTNINQIAEILHKIEKQFKYTPDELLIWMDRNSDDGEDYEQRIESDEDAVQISTIHKAKGLEYKIVFAPFLSMIPKRKLLEKGNVNDFKRGSEYFFTLNHAGLSPADQIIFDEQKEQENRRLIYVALTRAVYKCYISLVPRNYRNNPVGSSLSEILDHYPNNFDLIEIRQMPRDAFEKIDLLYKSQVDKPLFAPREKPAIEIKNTFGIHSYSALSKAHYSAPFEKAGLGSAQNYDQFIFQDLGRGANVGTALHSIFERLRFSKPKTWMETILDASKYYPNIIKLKDEKKRTESNLDHVYQMVNHVMRAQINLPGSEQFALCELDDQRKLPELGFYFSVDKVNRQVINQYVGEDATMGGETDIEGLMTGFMDLVFEHKERYYILDWKSNHLGNDVKNYGNDGMEEAMTGSNYHLQYMIYTVALKRWLEKKIAGFDFDKHFGGVIYVFLRGVREGGQTGIYRKRPEKDQIEALDSALSAWRQLAGK